MTAPASSALEQIYDTIATSIDKADSKRELFLTKFALLLAHEINDPKRVGALSDIALKDL